MLALNYLSEDSNDGSNALMANEFTLVHANGILNKLLGILYSFLRKCIPEAKLKMILLEK